MQPPNDRWLGQPIQAAGPTRETGWPGHRALPRRRSLLPPEHEERVSEPFWVRRPQAISLLVVAMFSALYFLDQLALVAVALLGLGFILARSLWNAD